MTDRRPWALLVALAAASTPALAFIARIYSLQEVLNESSHVYAGRVESVDAGKRIAVARVEQALKGRQEFRRIQMNIGVGPRDHADYLLARMRPGQPFIIYYKREGNGIASCVHAGDTWFQLFATDQRDHSKVWWRMSHLEVYMGRTFDGRTPDLIQITTDVLAGRRKAPPPNPKVAKLDPRKPARPVGPSRPPTQPIPAPPVADPRDGLEAVPGWTPETDWARPAKLAVVADKARGKVLRLDCDGRSQKKLAVTLLHHVDLSEASRLSADVENGSDRPLAVAIAFGSAPDWEMYEAPPATVPPKARAARVSFELAARHFKSKASAWQHIQPLPKRTFDKVMLLVEGLPGQGSVAFDRVRGARGGFQRGQEVAHPGGEARGIAWADVNGDERLDLVLCCGGGNVLLLNGGGTFQEATRAVGLKGGSRCAAWADYNADDHPDLLTSSFQLFTNVGGKLRDDSNLLPAPRSRNPEGAGWIDYNGDGRPDVLITNGEHGICLFENTGKGFRDVSDQAGLGPKGIGRGNGDFVAFADIGADGYTDFLYNLGKAVLAHNEGDGAFKLDEGSGIHIGASNDEKRGLAFADYDNDGDLDLFVPDRQRPRLYRNNNDGTFADVLGAAGDLANSPGDSFSAAWGDVNLDGCLDLFVCHTRGASRLYLGDGKGKFADATEAAGLGSLAPAFAASFADVDDDGDLDLVVNLDRKAVMLINEMDRAANHGPLAVCVQARKGLTGAVVRALDPQGKPLGLRELNGAESCGGQACPIAHFGLPVGKAQVSVCLSDGRVARKVVDVSANGTKLTLREEDFQ